jgi:hypothetical protein
VVVELLGVADVPPQAESNAPVRQIAAVSRTLTRTDRSMSW